jgi:hypothetical protein
MVQPREHLKMKDHLKLPPCQALELFLLNYPKSDFILFINIFIKWGEHSWVLSHMLSASTINYPMEPTGLVVHIHEQINQASILMALFCIGPVTFSIKDYSCLVDLGMLLWLFHLLLFLVHNEHWRQMVLSALARELLVWLCSCGQNVLLFHTQSSCGQNVLLFHTQSTWLA